MYQLETTCTAQGLLLASVLSVVNLQVAVTLLSMRGCASAGWSILQESPRLQGPDDVIMKLEQCFAL